MLKGPRARRFDFGMAAREARQNRWTAAVTKSAILAIGLSANSNFHASILPGGEQSPLLELIVIAAWGVIAVLSYFRRPIRRVEWGMGAYAAAAFYGFAMLSVMWSRDPAEGAAKAFALAITTFGAYRLTLTMPLDDIVECLIHALFALCFVSIGLSLFVPEIGVLTDWQHGGEWNGIFVSKQSLGITAAMALFMACYRLIYPPRRLYHALVAAAAIICVIGSGSRGGGALAAFAVLVLYLMGRSPVLAKVIAFVPLVMGLFGGALISYMLYTGGKYLVIFGNALDLTERTFIWQYALAHFWNAPWLGYGLNGFWTLKEVKDVFVEQHGWFLDNYHNGYIAIIMETGVIGFVLLLASYLLYGLRISGGVGRTGAAAREMAFTLVTTSLIFFIDFTETFFLRSTNMNATLLVIGIFVAFSYRTRPAWEGKGRMALTWSTRTAPGVSLHASSEAR